MKRIGKISFIILLLTLVISAAFAVASLAAEDSLISIEGAERVHEDFTGVTYEYHVNEDGGIPANPETKIGSLLSFESVSKKYGHLRTVTTPDGNTVLDLTFHCDYTGGATSKNDVVVSAVPKLCSLKDVRYFVVEFDMSSRSSFPGDIRILTETRIFSRDMKKEISDTYRQRAIMGSYSADDGAWTFGENTIALSRGEWAHITIVTEMVAVETEGVEGVTVNYGASKANIYLNGEYLTSTYPFPSAELDPTYIPVLYYAGVGYEYGKAHSGQRAGDSVSIDNATYTTFDSLYAEDTEKNRLAALFLGENPLRSLTDLGEEILYTSNYTFPSAVALASYKGENGAELPAADFESALAQIKAQKLQNATIRLYANQYRKVVMDYPVTVEMNGFSLQNGWEVSNAFAVNCDTENGILKIYEDPTRQATVHIYNAPYGTSASPALSEQYAVGREVLFGEAAGIAPEVIVNGCVGLVPTGEFETYNADGERVELARITEQNLGKVYHVYPVYTEVILRESISFYTEIDGEVSFYSERDLWSAANPLREEIVRDDDEMKVCISYPKAMPDNAKIVLVGDCTISEPLYTLGGNLTVDLAGHKLSATTAFATTGARLITTTITKQSGATNAQKSFFIEDMQIFVYSSAEGAALDTANADLLSADFNIGASNGVDYFFGYESEGVLSTSPITISFGARLVHTQKGALDTVHFASVTLYSRGTDGKGWIVDSQSRGRRFYFENCEIFLENHLAASCANTATKEIYFKNCSIYGNGQNQVSYLANYGADTPEEASALTTSGTITISLENSRIYSMSLGCSKLEGYHKASEGAEPTHRVTETKLEMDLTSMISCEPTALTSKHEGKKLLAMPTTKVVDGITYVSVYAWAEEATKSAVFHIYDLPFEQLTPESVPTMTQQVAIGYWFIGASAPMGESYYDPSVDAENLIAPSGYAVYDSEGNQVQKDALTDADADAFYRVCIVYDKQPISFRVQYADGTYAAFTTNNIGDALGTTLILNLSCCILPEGATVTLFSDCTTSGTLIGSDSYVDLNGHTMYAERKLASFGAQADKSLFVYSSKSGARICQTPTVDSGSGYVVEARNENSKIYLGYESAEKRCEHRIEVFCGAFAELHGACAQVYLSRLSVCANGRDNYGFLNIRGGTDTTRAFFLLECEIYSNRGGFFSIREGSGSGTLTMKNTNVYTSASAGIFSWYERRSEAISASIYMENSGLWGKITLGGLENGLGVATLYVSGDCTLPAVSKNVVLTEAGKSFVSTTPSVTLDGIKAPSSGVYGAAESVMFQGTLSSGYTVGIGDDFKSSAYVNISMDTSVVINFYIPAIKELSAVYMDERNLLDTSRTESIDGSSFYVISLLAAPKLGDKEFTLSAEMADGTSYEFTLSVARYAQKLLSLDSQMSSYVADAQQLMKYILTYIKEVALKYGGAKADEIFCELGDFAVDTEVEFSEVVHDTSPIKPYVTDAALNLDAYTGFAFRIAEGFVGTVRISLTGADAVEKTYTADAPAAKNEILVLENVPVHILRGDVTITVLTSTGEVLEAHFNLATYAATFNEAYLKALYAYAIAAKEYNTKYPTVGTAK